MYNVGILLQQHARTCVVFCRYREINVENRLGPSGGAGHT